MIEAGREREFLNWLPLDMLGLGKSDCGDDLGDHARAMGDAPARRAGVSQSRRGRHAAGTSRRRVGTPCARWQSRTDCTAPPRRVFRRDGRVLEYGIQLPEPLGFVMHAMLERLAEQAFTSWHGRRRYHARIRDERSSQFQSPGRGGGAVDDVRAILTLINLSLEAAPPEAAVESIRIEIAPRVPRPAQTDMFLPPGPAPDKLQTTIARLSALCGPGNVGMLSAENSHRPEATHLDASHRRARRSFLKTRPRRM